MDGLAEVPSSICPISTCQTDLKSKPPSLHPIPHFFLLPFVSVLSWYSVSVSVPVSEFFVLRSAFLLMELIMMTLKESGSHAGRQAVRKTVSQAGRQAVSQAVWQSVMQAVWQAVTERSRCSRVLPDDDCVSLGEEERRGKGRGRKERDRG